MVDKKDKSVEELANGQSDLSRLYARVGKTEPSADLDKTILDAAKAEVNKGSRASGPFGSSWFIPASLAAVLVLAVGIVITMKQEVGIEQYEADQYQPSVAKPAPVPMKEKRKQPAVEQKASRARPESSGLTADKEAKPAKVQSAPKLFRQPSEPVPAAEPNVLQEAAPAEAETVKSAPAAIEQVPTEETLPLQDRLRKLEADTGVAADEEQPQAEEKWLNSIRELIKQNKLENARNQLADFRRVYPDYPLGEEFKDLVK